ncbi:MAG: cell division protein FtsQ/DivIB [Pseudomonadota bacterium]
MNLKSPGNFSPLNRLDSEIDVLMDAPRKVPRVRTSIVGDKKLTSQDAFEQRDTANRETNERKSVRSEAVQRETVKREPMEREAVRREPAKREQAKRESVGGEPIGREAPWEKTKEQKSNERSASTKRGTEASPRLEARNRDPLIEAQVPRADTHFRRERGYSKASPQGSSNAVKEVRAKVSRIVLYRGLGLMVLLCAFAGCAYFISGPIAKLLERPLKSVAVEGRFQYFPKERAMELIAAEIDGDFLQLELEDLKAVLQADPWVENVYLSRRWPDTLVVKVAEQQPIARWDANGFLNQRGEIIRVKEVDKLLGLPWLQGNEINAREIMQQYQDLSTLLRARGLEISILSCDNKKSWRITLKNDVEIAIGRDQVMEKMRRFVTVYDNFLNGVWADVKSIDVRYTNGVSVRWVTDSVMAKKYLKPDAAIKSGTVKPKAAAPNGVVPEMVKSEITKPKL